MPELPEVETLCRQLQDKIAGEKIRATEIFDLKLSEAGNIGGLIIREVRRSGKTILMVLEDGRSIAIHLRMTGRLFWQRDNARVPHVRWRLQLSAGNIDLVDPRRFATVKIITTPRAMPANDLMTNFEEKDFLERQVKRKVNIKTLLMDPKALAGIGNIYACEIMHRAGISPARRSDSISGREWKTIFRDARRILKKGIENRGTSISDWRDLYGCPGENQRELKAYGREGKKCRNCGGVIVRIKQGGRSTFYCPQCQK